MVDENEREDTTVGEMPEETHQPADGEPDGGAAADGGLNAAADEVRPPAVPQDSDPGALKPQGGGIKGWFAKHKILAGAGIGILAALLIAGVFIIGYFVGKPCDEREERGPAQQFQYQGPMEPDLRPAPSPGRRGAGQDRLDVLVEYRDEIDSVVARELGISTDELLNEMEAGKTIAEIAEEKGVSSEDLTAAVAAEISKIADKLAADGGLTTEQAKNIKSKAVAMAEMYIERGHRLLPMPFE
jgi:hypothetical protein